MAEDEVVVVAAAVVVVVVAADAESNATRARLRQIARKLEFLPPRTYTAASVFSPKLPLSHQSFLVESAFILIFLFSQNESPLTNTK